MAHQTSHEELAQRLDEARSKVKVGGVYYHWRNPAQHYKVLGVGFCEWDETLCVIYQQIGVENSLTWVRRFEGEDGFLTPVEENSNSHPRFYQIGD